MTNKYSKYYKYKIVLLVKKGYSIKEVCEEFEPSEPTVRSWVDSSLLEDLESNKVDKWMLKRCDEARKMVKYKKKIFDLVEWFSDNHSELKFLYSYK
jgi:transposase-like protein